MSATYTARDGSTAQVWLQTSGDRTGWRIDYRSAGIGTTRGGRADAWTPIGGPRDAHRVLLDEGYAPPTCRHCGRPRTPEDPAGCSPCGNGDTLWAD